MSKNIYAVHDYSDDWAGIVRAANREAWCVHTEAVGSDPNDRSGKQYPAGVSNIVRINAGYGNGGDGTIPVRSRYREFAQRCANFVAASEHIEYVIIGNEQNMKWDWPEDQPITLDDYMECYILCYDAIKLVAPAVKIGPAAVGTWNDTIKYTGNERGDWVKLQLDTWTRAGRRIDALYIHAYSHGYDPALVKDLSRMGAPFADRHFNFPVYQDFMCAIPQTLRRLPLFITETNGDCKEGENVAWPSHNTGWVSAMYAEIERWNKTTGNQQIMCAALFRWAPHDTKWDISTKTGAIEDFRNALAADYQWKVVETPKEEVRPPAFAFALGDRVRPTREMRLRASPGYVGKADDTVLMLKEIDMLDITNAIPTSRDGLLWWEVKVQSGQSVMAGWVVQSTPDGIALLSKMNPTLGTFKAGDLVVALATLNMRSAASRTGEVIRGITAGTTLSVIGGPVSSGGLVWWECTVDSLDGWCAEQVNSVQLLKPSSGDLVTELCHAYMLEPKVVRAVMRIESGNSGFDNGRVKIRFEPWIFFRYIRGEADKVTAFLAKFTLGPEGEEWKGDHHKLRSHVGWIECHGHQDREWAALNAAILIDDRAAYNSISMGIPQIMGFNCGKVGYASAKSMLDDFAKGEDVHIKAMFKFFNETGAIRKLREKDYVGFAFIYNGAGQAEHYGGLIRQAVGG